MNAKVIGFVSCVETIIYLLLYNFHYCSFNYALTFFWSLSLPYSLTLIAFFGNNEHNITPTISMFFVCFDRYDFPEHIKKTNKSINQFPFLILR